MSKTKLEELGIDLPKFPITAVGSFPKPKKLKKARTRRKNGEISQDELLELEKELTTFWIEKQEEIGCDVLVDGEMYRGDMVAYFAEHLSGFDRGGLVRSYGNRYYYKPIVEEEVHWEEPITVDRWEFADEQTDKPVKAILTGPYTIMDWSFNEYYSDRRETALALAREMRKEVEALVDAGAKIVQIDEPATSVRMEEIDLVRDTFQTMTEDLDAYFITHICYGEFLEIYPDMLEFSIDNFDLEMSNSELDLLPAFQEDPFTKDLSFGSVDVHSHEIESKDEVLKRIEEARKLLDDDQIWIDPDCGMKTRTIEETTQKFEVISEAVEEVRNTDQ